MTPKYLSSSERAQIVSPAQRFRREYDAMIQTECDVAAQIMAQDATVTRSQALREAAVIVERWSAK